MWLLLQLDGILFSFLLLSSSSVFQSAAVPGGRKTISPPSPSPTVVCNFYEHSTHNKNRMDAEESNFENVANSIFGDTNPFLCKWDNLYLASKKGAVKTNFRFHTNNFKSVVQDKNNNAFFQGLISIKYLVGLIWICYYLFTTKDFFFLLTIPVSFVFGLLIERLWHRRFIATFLSIAIIITAGKLLNLSGHYYWFLTFIILISSQIHSVYNTFLTEVFYATENNFVIGIDEQYIAEIYDGIKGKKHKGPFFMHKVKF